MNQRKAYLTFCEQTLINHVVSKKFFLTHYFKPLIELKQDKVMAIRRKFRTLAELVIINLISKDDRDQRLELVSALDSLKNDTNNDVSEQAYDSE